MPVTRDRKTGRWIYNEVVRKLNGKRERIKGRAPKHCNTKEAATLALRQHRERVENPGRAVMNVAVPLPDVEAEAEAKQVITFDEWFNGRFWREWVVAQKNKHTEVKSKRFIYEGHLKPAFGDRPLDAISTADIAAFRASLVEKGLSEKRVNNVLAVLSKSLRYALDAEVLEKLPRIGSFKIEAPEIEPWDFDEYPRILDSAWIEGPDWYVAVCLAGESGFRAGEIKALDWRKHVALISKMLMVKEQTCDGVTGTPKGRTRRGVPMTSTVERALLALPGKREGYVVRNADGSAKTDGQFNAAIIRICNRAGLPIKRWHRLRHTFGTHAAMCGVNPWTLQAWMGHKRIEETMRYVHVAKDHRRPLPPQVVAAGQKEIDPDQRIIAMLGGRVPNGPRLHLIETEKPVNLAS